MFGYVDFFLGEPKLDHCTISYSATHNRVRRKPSQSGHVGLEQWRRHGSEKVLLSTTDIHGLG